MHFELDHLFVCTAPGVPEAEKLVEFGLHEGPPNQHPGQGTAINGKVARLALALVGALTTIPLAFRCGRKEECDYHRD
jgi:hypothetical protein